VTGGVVGGFCTGWLIITTGELALLWVAVIGMSGMLARVVLVTPHGESAPEPAAGRVLAPGDGPVTSLDPQPTAATAQRATMKAHERTTVIFQPLGLFRLRPELASEAPNRWKRT